MKIIIPMAGIGKRMRPHTLSIPKPLLKVAGKSIVERIVKDITASTGKKIEEVHFVIGNFGHETVNKLLNVAKSIGAKGYIYYQNEPLGTAHAVYCADEALNGEVLIAFADTLFIGNFEITDSDEAIIWTMDVLNPDQYGVVVTDNAEFVTDFIEKPKKHVSNKAIIGIYYFKEGSVLRDNIKNLISKNLRTSNEFQLTDCLKDLMEKGIKFKCKKIKEWLDCGVKDEFLLSNKKILSAFPTEIDETKYDNCLFIEPVYIGENVILKNCKIGPYVSIDNNSIIEDTFIKESIVGSDNYIIHSDLAYSMIGNSTTIKGCKGKINIGDYNSYENL
jgi:glucose-1-phosphate thymidylyltransferase